MKVKVFRTQSEILEIVMLITIISISNCLQITTGSNIESPKSSSDNINNIENFTQKNLINEAKNEEISTFKYFKNFISNVINREKNIENSRLSDKDLFTHDGWDLNLRNKFNSNKRKNLNFNSESVKIAEVQNCNLDNCNEGNGRCISEHKCQCKYPYINIPGISKKTCDHKLSYQLTAIVLEMLLPIGFGHFYCKRYLIGFIKFSVLFLIPVIIFAILKAYLVDDENFKKLKQHGNNKFFDFFNLNYMIKRLVSFYFLIIFFMWYLFDLVIFAANKHKDGSGYDLIPIYNR